MSGNKTQKSVNNVFTKMHSITKCIINKKICASQHIVWPLRWKQQENFTISRHLTKPADQTLRSILKFLEYNQNISIKKYERALTHHYMILKTYFVISKRSHRCHIDLGMSKEKKTFSASMMMVYLYSVHVTWEG